MMARWVKTALIIASSRHSKIVHLFAEDAAITAWPDPEGGGGRSGPLLKITEILGFLAILALIP